MSRINAFPNPKSSPLSPPLRAAVRALAICAFVVGPIAIGQTPTIRNLYSCGLPTDSRPGSLIPAPDGYLYTTLGAGGRLNRGAVVRFDPDAATFTNLFDLGTTTTNETPGGTAKLIGQSDGWLYGVIEEPSPPDRTNHFFRISTNGTGFTRLCGLPQSHEPILLTSDRRVYFRDGPRLQRFDADGTNPVILLTNSPALVGLIEAADDRIYGHDAFTIFHVPSDGSPAAPLVVSARPIVGLADGRDGRLYASADNTPASLDFFATDYAGIDPQPVGSLSLNQTNVEITPLVDGNDGAFYAVVRMGTSPVSNHLVRVIKSGGAGLIVDLPADHFGPLTPGVAGLLIGSAETGGTNDAGLVYSILRNGQNRTTRHVFAGIPAQSPSSDLAWGSEGRLYGTTRDLFRLHGGMVFRLDPDGGRFTVLHTFNGQTDGADPRSGVILASDGLLYGTTYASTTTNLGALYRLNPGGGGFQILMNFTAATGTNPAAMLLEGSDGFLYGSCSSGGTAPLSGTLWRIRKDGSSFSLIKMFAPDGMEGRRPSNPLIEASDGLLYGTTSTGGSSNLGTIFRIGKDGSDFQVLRHLTGSGDAANPVGRLLPSPDGKLIGASFAGGSAGVGSIFSLNPDGTDYRVIHSFLSTDGDGNSPSGGLVPIGNGTLLGVARMGGREGAGVLYSIRSDGSDYSIVHEFSTNHPSGRQPLGALTAGPTGVFFGRTVLGGLSTNGTVFQFHLTTPDSPPELEVQTSATGLEIVWSDAYPEFQLLTASALTVPVSWSPVTPQPAASGGFFRHPLTATSPAAFFRLTRDP